MCEMRQTKSGIFTRASRPFVEIEAFRNDSYRDFVKRAAQRTQTIINKTLALFKLNGARVLDKEVTVKGKIKPWTLGNYLLLLKKSPYNIKMGVGYIMDAQSSTDSDSQDSSKVHNYVQLFSWHAVTLQ